MIKKFLRFLIALVGVVTGYGVALLFFYLCRISPLAYSIPEYYHPMVEVGIALLFGVIFYFLAPLVRRQSIRVAASLETDLQKIPTHDLISGTFGLLIGLLIAFLISQLWVTIQITYLGVVLSVISYILCSFLGVVIATRKGRDVVPGVLKKIGAGGKGKAKGQDASPKILDTSVIIDGRIADIMKTGFIEGSIIIPEFVLVELRHIADSSDGLKRNRGRRGLDILNRIQNEHGIEIFNTAAEKALHEIPEVDVKLLKLAQILGGKVVTNDYNLNKVATIKGVAVLNINELANTLKPVVLPGEDMTLFLVKEGKENNQAVAYLDDGTMIVVEEGRRYIGQTIEVTVTSVLQTSAGRMIFAKPKKAA